MECAEAERSAALTRSKTINIRVDPRQRDLIDRAAETAGKTRSDFILEVSCREAEAVLLDRRLFMVDDETFTRFVERLDQPPAANERLRELLARKPLWEK